MAAAIETKLYVTNFPSSATRQQLQQFFSRFGRVQECAIMWNSYAFVHYATMDEARRALDQSNGAMFLNRKLIVQLSTSRFRPQPKEANNSLAQPPKQLMVMSTPPSSSSSSSITYQHLPNGGGSTNNQQQQQQPNTLTQQYPNEVNYDMLAGYNAQHSSAVSDGNNFFSNTYRPPSPFYLSQEMNNGYYSQYPNLSMDRMTPSPLSVQLNKMNSIKSNKNLKTDIGTNGEIPKLYCTNLPENCKAHDLENLFSSFGHVIDCVILWDYYAFVTYKTFIEADRALHTLHGYTWKDRRLIVEWSRASGRRQQQTSPSPTATTSGIGSFGSELSTPPSPRSRPSTLLSHQAVSNGQFYGNNSPKVLSPLKSQSPHHTFNQNLAMMSMIQQQQQQPVLHHHHHHHHSSLPFGAYTNRNNVETLINENQPIFDSLTNSSSTHHLDLSPFIDSNTSNSNARFPTSSDLPPPSSPASTTNVYQPSDIAALLEPLSSNISTNTKSTENSIINDITNTFSPTAVNIQSSCSSTAAAAAAAAALFQENLLSSLFGSLEPFSKLFPVDEQSSTSSTSRYHHLLPASPLLTTAPDNSHHPIYCGHNTSWH
ncbi:hypothetical protein I4U23_029155 [Adineta vaga]|nr:hypothetical protein I4U23_029155 [Adineta vaga]